MKITALPKDRLIILDFWSSWCTACIDLFPHLDSLQNRFKDSLQIFLVNLRSRRFRDDRVKIQGILAGIAGRTGHRINLPVIYNNDSLDAYFPVKSVPQEVWISPEGRIIAITTGKELTVTNIQKIISGQKINLHMKKDNLLFNRTHPLFINGNGGYGSETIFRSLLTGHVEGIPGGNGQLIQEGKLMGFYAHNENLMTLVRHAYQKILHYPANRIIIDSDDPYFNIPYSDTNADAHTYCYELLIPHPDEEQALNYMQQDLKRYLNISVTKLIRNIPCLILSRDETRPWQPSAGAPDMDLEPGDARKFLHNYTPAQMLGFLNRQSPIPILDETGINQTCSIDLPHDPTHLPELRAAFHKIGLKLSEDRRPLEMALISDK